MFKKRSKISISKDSQEKKRRKLEPTTASTNKHTINDDKGEAQREDVDDIPNSPSLKRVHIKGTIASSSSSSSKSRLNEINSLEKENEKVTEDENDNESTLNTDSPLGGTLNINMKGSTLSQIKQPKNVKQTILMDYQPDVCKDFKQTGYCGYGDSCKFLHSRDDFKAGWKLNQDWKINDDTSSSIINENIPFKCVICKNDYKNPIVTNCGHYFCANCFSNRMVSEKNSKCFICNEDTQGVARIATDLKKNLKNRIANET
ncbi:U2-type spliceosomal complex subunit CWC24 NDAI_0J01720 [Naumovozyma dairenensis CBS 421]|uniref:Pre-mRNA-splicing factor CWC24 n=1 Tax=Naumovozyma dairenensis (strain ATCC 10597 / BCRC 20456 / CBS 421 / NBRC 0211 / NRRL Y-12639) TaxID=1071378 RepID=G0WGY6_NAUDC|nr:hypothetical protein NDAI_0J01720 [Naumovozyma dairenensis CBS 421]CCD27064.1 hypothetical protein NDAI_0J01720 [Naumovozyma dairenensis CBS 421]